MSKYFLVWFCHDEVLSIFVSRDEKKSCEWVYSEKSREVFIPHDISSQQKFSLLQSLSHEARFLLTNWILFSPTRDIKCNKIFIAFTEWLNKIQSILHRLGCVGEFEWGEEEKAKSSTFQSFLGSSRIPIVYLSESFSSIRVSSTFLAIFRSSIHKIRIITFLFLIFVAHKSIKLYPIFFWLFCSILSCSLPYPKHFTMSANSRNRIKKFHPESLVSVGGRRNFAWSKYA